MWFAVSGVDLEMQKGLLASLQAACGFASTVSKALPALTQLLASSSVTDVQVSCVLPHDQSMREQGC